MPAVERVLGVLLAAGLVLGAAVPVAAGADPNPTQRGDNSLCLDHDRRQGTVFAPVTDRLWGPFETAPTAAVAAVDAGTWFAAGAEGPAADAHPELGDEVHLDFWTEEGRARGAFTGTHGRVPAGAAYATVCVGLVGTFTDAPSPGAEWWYRDGYATPAYGDG